MGGVHAIYATLGQTFGLGLHRLRAQSRAQHHRLAGLEFGSSAILPPQNRLGLGGIHHGDQKHTIGGQTAGRMTRRRHGQGPMRQSLRLGLGIGVIHPHRPGQVPQTGQHGTAHIARPDHRNLRQRCHVCTNCLDLAIDIKMPKAKPRVTMAVPP